MSKPACRRCGRCCAVKIVVEGHVIYTKDYCKHFDRATRLCTVYQRRHEVNPDCTNMADAVRMGVLPADCPYVADVPDYIAPIEHPQRVAGLELDDLEIVEDPKA